MLTAITHIPIVIMVIGVRVTEDIADVVIMVIEVMAVEVMVTKVMVGIADSTLFRSIAQSCEYLGGGVGQMRGFLINKNLCFYYWLRKRIGKKQAYKVSNTLERVILIFGRETIS